MSVKGLIICIIFLMFFSIFVNIYFVILGQLLATTKSLTLFIREVLS